MPTALTDLDVSWVSFVDRAAVRDQANKSQPQRFLVWKADGTDAPQSNEGGFMPTATAEELQEQLTKAEEERDTARKAAKKAEKKLAKLAKDTEGEDGGPYKKPQGKKESDDAGSKGDSGESQKKAEALAKADPEVRALLEKAEADRQTLADRLEKAEADSAENGKIAKAERDARLTREFVAKAEAEMPSLSLAPADLGPVLKAASKQLTKDEYEALEGVLKAASEQIAKGELFKEAGRGGQPEPGDAIGELSKAADEIRKAEPDLSTDQALAKAMKNDRALQERYLQEIR